MPTYEYECLKCNHKFSVFQSINDEPVKKCEKCQGKVRKIFGATGIIFKGSGFYVNDYKKKPATDIKQTDASKTKKETSCPATAKT